MCPVVERWYEYKYNLLDEPERTTMERHLAQCSTCSDFLHALNKVVPLLDNAAPAQAPPASSPPLKAPCPDAENLAYALAGSLPETELDNIHAHLTECPRCRRVLMDLHRLLQAAHSKENPLPAQLMRRECFERALGTLISPGTGPATKRHGALSDWVPALRRWLLIPASALALGLMIFSLRFVYIAREAVQLVTTGTEALHASFGTIRPSELRLSSGFIWSPPQVRSAMSDEEKKSLADAEAALTRAWSLRPQDAKTNHALGRFYLAKSDYALAEKYLTTALRLDAQSAQVYNDLGVLAYERGDFEKAMDYVDRAVGLDPKYPEAIFNAAFLQIRYRRNAAAARSLVERYRQLDPNSGWLADLEKELKRLSS